MNARPLVFSATPAVPNSSIAPSRTRAAELLRASIPAAIVVAACIVRILPVVSANFPIGDGGLFDLMVNALRRAHYHLPVTVAYNGRVLPFAYPPLGFYATGLLADVGHMSVPTAMRVLPLLVSIATLAAFGLLARDVLGSRTRTLAALFAFGMLPLSFRYFIMGAGITRSPGLLFAVLTIWQAHRLYSRRQARHIGPTALFAGLTILSHPNATWFAAGSVVLLGLYLGRNRRSLLHTLLAGLGALCITAPWWATILTRHGLTPFLSASQSGSPETSGLVLLLQLRVTAEPVFPVLMIAALIGIGRCLRARRSLLPVWLLVSCALDTRYSGTFAMVPLALLSGIGVDTLLGVSRSISGGVLRRFVGAGMAGLVGMLALFLVFSTAALPGPALGAVPGGERDAMAWVRTHTPPGSTFLIVAPAGDSAGSESEWFPTLTGRVSLAAYQGTEWLKQTRGPSLWQRYDDLQSCGSRGAGCLERWAQRSRMIYDYVFVRRQATGQLQRSLLRTATYAPAYENGDTEIFTHLGRR